MITWTDISCGQYLEGVVPAGRESSRNHRSRALLILSLTLALALGMAGVPGSAEAAPTLKTAPIAPIAGESFSVSTTLSTKVARAIVLQKKSAGKWRTVKKGKSSATGRVSLSTSTKLTSIQLRVLAPKTRVKHRVYKKITSRTITIRTTKQTISLKLPTGTYVNKAVTANITAGPARPGRRVQIQLLSDGKWKPVAAATQDTSGRATLSLASTKAGRFTYRAVVIARAGASAINSTGRGIEIRPDPTTVAEPARPLADPEVSAIEDYNATTGTLTFNNPPPSISTIRVGDYLPIPPTEGAQSGALRKVTSVGTKDGVTTVSTSADASLPDIIDNVPDDASSIALSTISSSIMPDEGVTVASNGLRPEETAGGLSATSAGPVVLNIRTRRQQGPLFVELNGTAELTPVIDLAFDMDWGKLKTYKLGTGIDGVVTVDTTAGLSASQSFKLPIAKIRLVEGGFIGPVPIWVEATFEIFAEVTAEGTLEVKTELIQTGRATTGVTNSADSLRPKLYAIPMATSSTLKAVQGTGSLSFFFGRQESAMIYSAKGLYAKAGTESKIELTNELGNDEIRCELTHGPVEEVGIKTSDLFEKLTGSKYEDTFSTHRALKPYPCPDLTGGPTTVGRVGTPTSVVLVDDSEKVSSAAWVSQLPGATISTPEPTTPLEIRFTPPAPGTYSYRVKVNFTNGSTKEFAGRFKGIAIPARSIRVHNIQTTYVPEVDDPCCGLDYSRVSFQLENTSSSESTPLRELYSREDPATDSFSYLKGDVNSNRKLDSGETWTYQGRIFWLNTGESETRRTRTIEIRANDESGAQPWLETEAPVTVTR